MKIYKITEASAYLGISINSLKTLANNNKINSFRCPYHHPLGEFYKPTQSKKV